MRSTLIRVTCTAGMLVALVVLPSLPASAADLAGVNLTQANVQLTTPGPVQRNVTTTAAGLVTLFSGSAPNACASEELYTDDTSLPGPCWIDNNSGSPGSNSGSIIRNSCATWTVTAGSSGSLHFREGGRSWKITSLRLEAGTYASGASSTWQLNPGAYTPGGSPTGSYFRANEVNGLGRTLTMTLSGSVVAPLWNCDNGTPNSNFNMTVSGVGIVEG